MVEFFGWLGSVPEARAGPKEEQLGPPPAEAAQHGKAEQRDAEQRECAGLGYLHRLPQIVADNVQGGNVVARYRMSLIRAGKRIVRVRRIGCVPVLRIAAEGVWGVDGGVGGMPGLSPAQPSRR